MQSFGKQDSVSVSIDKKLDEKLFNLSPSPSEFCIFRVHNELRSVNEKAYEPEIVAIGPYHHGKERLQLMEEHKLRYLQSLLHRKNEDSVERYASAIRSLEKQARRCYAERISLTPDEMIEMMLLDGCFIIELILKVEMPGKRQKEDPIFHMDWMLRSLKRDLMLFENQLLFFILCKLFDMIEGPNLQIKWFIDHGFEVFRDLLPRVECREQVEGNSMDGIKHLLGMIYHKWVPSFDGAELEGNEQNEKIKRRFIPSATELKEAGVKLEKVKCGTLFDIKYQNGVLRGVLQISPLKIEDWTESFFRNLIAYEQYCPDKQLCYITDYLTFMNSLVDSPKDVALLSRRGIIDNWIGDDEVVSKMFNTIGDAITQRSNQFHYVDIFSKVNTRCEKRCSRWTAKLNRNYLNSPWAFISVLAALVLLLLTFTQTYYSVFHPK